LCIEQVYSFSSATIVSEADASVQVTAAVTFRVEYDKKEMISRNVRCSRDYRKKATKNLEKKKKNTATNRGNCQDEC